MDPLQWMGAVRMRVQTVDKNITIYQLMYCETKRLHQSIHEKIDHILTLKLCFWQRHKSSVHNIYAVKIHLIWIKRERSSTVYKRKQSKTVLNKYISGFLCERTGFSLDFTSDVMLNLSMYLFQWRNKLIYILDGLRVSTFSAIFYLLTFSLTPTHIHIPT